MEAERRVSIVACHNIRRLEGTCTRKETGPAGDQEEGRDVSRPSGKDIKIEASHEPRARPGTTRHSRQAHSLNLGIVLLAEIAAGLRTSRPLSHIPNLAMAVFLI